LSCFYYCVFLLHRLVWCLSCVYDLFCVVDYCVVMWYWLFRCLACVDDCVVMWQGFFRCLSCVVDDCDSPMVKICHLVAAISDPIDKKTHKFKEFNI
jgi:hypothetical protein